MNEVNITQTLVAKLIDTQFPQYNNLEIRPIDLMGIDNQTFHLGDNMLVRLPSRLCYASQPLTEQQWLPFLRKYLPLEIPTPLHLGNRSTEYPYHWSIYKFITGNSLNTVTLNHKDAENLALKLAKFIKKLHKIPTYDAPHGGINNFYRGCHISTYSNDAKVNIQLLADMIDSVKAIKLLDIAINSQWSQEPVWVHGDIAVGNIIIKDKKLKAIIDFGCMGIGDPACDLVIAWNFFKGNARKIFKDFIDLDCDTWNRASAWALWKASFELTLIEDKKSKNALQQTKIIHDILSEVNI